MLKGLPQMESAVDNYVKQFDGSHYNQSIEAIEHLWEKCIEHEGDYVKK